jgi:tape measure domain-containing protein
VAGTTLILNLTAEGGSQVTSTINNISRASESAGASIDKMGTLGRAATYALGQAMYSVASQMTQLVESVVVGGIKMDASIQQNQVAFEGLTGSADKAKASVDGLVKIAANTNYNTDQVVAWGKSWVAAGGNVDYVVASVTVLTDAFSHWGLTTDQANRFMSQFTQSMMVGKLQWQDIKIMMEDGIPVVHELAKAYHVTDGAMVSMIQSGQLLSRDALPKLQEQLKSDSAGAAAKQAGTLAGAWDNLTDKLYIAVAKGIEPYNAQVANGLVRFTDLAVVAVGHLIDKIPALIELGKAAKQHLEGPFHRFADVLTDRVVPAVESMGRFLRDNADKVLQIAAAVTAAIGAFKAIGSVVSIIGAVAAAVADPVLLVVAGVAALVGAAVYAYQNFQPFHDLLDNIASNVMPALQTAIAAVGNFWTTYLQPPLQEAVNSILPKLAELWGVVVQNLGPGSQVFLFVQQVFAVLGPLLRDIIIPALSFIIQKILDFLIPAFKMMGWVLNNVVVPAIRFLGQLFMTTVGNMLHVADTMFGWIPGIGPKLHDAASAFDRFAADVNRSLGSIQDQSVTIGINTYDPVTGTSGSGRDEGGGSRVSTKAPPSGGRVGSSSANVSYMWKYLKGQGFTDAAAAGVIGTLQGESGKGLNTTAVGDHGTSYGIAQWHNGRWNNLVSYAHKHGMAPSELAAQAGFLMQELGQGASGGSLSSLKSMKNVDAVVARMVRNFERPADVAGNIRRRSVLGENVYKQMNGKGGSYGSGGSGSSKSGGAYGGLGGAAPFDTSTISRDLSSTRGTLWDAYYKNGDQFRKAMYNLQDDVAKAGNAVANRVVKSYMSTMVNLSVGHEKLIKKLEDARKSLQKLRDDSSKLSSQVYSNILATGDVSKGDGKDFGSIIFQLQNAVQWAKNFQTAMAELKKRGLGNAAIQQLIEAGPQAGMAYAQSILAQGKSGINQINQLQGMLGRSGSALGKTAADSQYAAAIHAAEGFVKGLQSQESRLMSIMKKLANAMAGALKKALGIHSPSRVFMEIGHFTADGLIHGMNNRRDAVMNTAADLVAMGQGSRTPRVPAARSGGAVVNHITIQGAIDPVATARQIKKVLATGDARGVNGGS